MILKCSNRYCHAYLCQSLYMYIISSFTHSIEETTTHQPNNIDQFNIFNYSKYLPTTPISQDLFAIYLIYLSTTPQLPHER